MKRTLIIAALAAIVSFVYASDSDSRDGRETKTFTVSKGGNLDVYISGGDLLLQTWGKDNVTVVAEGIEEEDMRYLSMTQDGATVRVNFRPHRNSSNGVRFTISIPSQFNADMHTSGGDIVVEGAVTGKLNGSTSGGDIRTGAIEGPTSLKTSGGNISLGKINGLTDVKTSGGDIRIESVSKNLIASTSGGNVEVGDVGGEAQLRTSGGDIRAGKVSGRATLKTAGGSIELASASGTTEATTAGGDLRLRNVTGSINAKTAGGNIDAELMPSGSQGSDLKTAGGDVYLSVPADAKATIDATINLRSYDRHNANDYTIHSDFEAATTPAVEKDGDQIHAVYKINGGGETITVSTTNGNIRIRKLSK